MPSSMSSSEENLELFASMDDNATKTPIRGGCLGGQWRGSEGVGIGHQQQRWKQRRRTPPPPAAAGVHHHDQQQLRAEEEQLAEQQQRQDQDLLLY
ncbi:hypothetical protein ZWY2020_057614 [Hordeum vulgare]|nr:hypothetical protein ZWY2020_057614 [Hordeum vulgare]